MQSLQMQLLHLLQEDCRLTLEQLATMTGSSVEAVGTMIDDMEKSGVILRYAPVINWDKTDRERVEAMIEVRVTPQRDQGFDAILPISSVALSGLGPDLKWKAVR